ncbi:MULTISPECIES: 6-phosphofructokinase [unclassified Ornithinimicrobium]|uniref:6-phosphofructokinase n=1 Tax=unclassified Ornithinimicrobium TaxID=2615080 RepID=UPI0038519593
MPHAGSPTPPPGSTPDPSSSPVRIGVLTSGGDSPGMNAAVRAVVRTTLRLGGEPYAVLEGWRGAVTGGDLIRPLGWSDVSGILQRGGTVLGTARSPEFVQRDGRRRAVRNLVQQGIDRLVVIGGDGSLRGAEELRTEWAELLDELVASGEVPAAARDAHPRLVVAGLVGSIDNDMAGTDMTIGADTALHRIIAALDAIGSTAASHQRTFVVEVMGRHCGYLALMAGIAGGADAVLLPEGPPAQGWQAGLVQSLERARSTGQRDALVIVAEGATDLDGNRITSADVEAAIGERLGERARVTILGHVQRGGRPSAYDRWMPTLLGHAAARQLLEAGPDAPSQVVGVRHNTATASSLPASVAATNTVRDALAARDYATAAAARGSSFVTLTRLVGQLTRAPEQPVDGPPSRRVAVLHVGGVAPGMNTAVRALVRFGLSSGLSVLGVQGSFEGLVEGRLRELGWAEVDGWVGQGGAVLGTSRRLPDEATVAAVADSVRAHRLDALVLVGGLDAYRAAALLDTARAQHPELALPVVCLPASIDNNLPGADLSVGADTALNTIVEMLDKIRTSASATRRCFVAETKGGRCGYLTMMSGIASGAERVYLPEDRLRIAEIAEDARRMTRAFEEGCRLYLVLRNEKASEHYTTDLVARIFEEEGGALFDVRHTVLGHVQDGGDPTPFDRLLATRLARAALDEVLRQLAAGEPQSCSVGEVGGELRVTSVDRLEEEVDVELGQPRAPWWTDLRPLVGLVSDRLRDPAAHPVPLVRTEDA